MAWHQCIGIKLAYHQPALNVVAQLFSVSEVFGGCCGGVMAVAAAYASIVGGVTSFCRRNLV